MNTTEGHVEADDTDEACTCGIEETPARRAHYGAELHAPYCPVGKRERAQARTEGGSR